MATMGRPESGPVLVGTRDPSDGVVLIRTPAMSTWDRLDFAVDSGFKPLDQLIKTKLVFHNIQDHFFNGRLDVMITTNRPEGVATLV